MSSVKRGPSAGHSKRRSRKTGRTMTRSGGVASNGSRVWRKALLTSSAASTGSKQDEIMLVPRKGMGRMLRTKKTVAGFTFFLLCWVGLWIAAMVAVR